MILTDNDRESQKLALEAVDDFRVITSAITDLGRKLDSRYELSISLDNGLRRKVTDKDLWVKLFDECLAKAKLDFLERQRRAGVALSSFDSHYKSIGQKGDWQAKLLLNRVKLSAWNQLRGGLLEALSVLTVLHTSQSNKYQQITNLIGKIGPIEIIEEGIKRFLWTQPLLDETTSGLKARPDIVITNSSRAVSPETILHIVECKNVRDINASLIRGEFGKAHDLKVSSYTILSFYEVRKSLTSAAKNLGIDLQSIELYGANRQKYISSPNSLALAVSSIIEKSRKEKRFLSLLDSSSKDARAKLLPRNQ
jgi:hypothetical protein